MKDCGVRQEVQIHSKENIINVLCYLRAISYKNLLKIKFFSVTSEFIIFRKQETEGIVEIFLCSVFYFNLKWCDSCHQVEP